MPHECGNRATNAQASEALNVRSDAREDSQSRGASGQDPETSRADTGEECAARVGQGRDAEQLVENKQRSAHSPENRADPQGQSRTKERGRERNRPPKSASHRQRKRSPAPTEKHTRPQLDATPAESAQNARESTSDLPPHRALGGFAQATAALVASAPTSTSGVSRLGDGGCSDSGRRGEAVGVEEGAPVAVRVGRDV